MEIELPPDQEPAPEVADLAAERRKRNETPFFTIRQPYEEKCDHSRYGATLIIATRRVLCKKCGEQIDPFDALLMYARGERRLQDTRHYIEEDRKKKAEQEARRPFSKKVEAYQAALRGTEIVGYVVTLSCGHKARWGKRRPPRTLTCEVCYLDSKRDLKAVQP